VIHAREAPLVIIPETGEARVRESGPSEADPKRVSFQRKARDHFRDNQQRMLVARVVEPWLDTSTPDAETIPKLSRHYPDSDTPTLLRHSDTEHSAVNRHSVRHSDTSVRPHTPQ
jgi:hypothetical protein